MGDDGDDEIDFEDLGEIEMTPPSDTDGEGVESNDVLDDFFGGGGGPKDPAEAKDDSGDDD